MNLDLYVVTDRKLTRGRSLLKIIEGSLEGGASIIQLREKEISTRGFIELALQVKELLRRYDAKFIINDRVDVAQAVGADGVHLGQDDMPAVIARRILGEDAIIGVSVSSVEEARRAVEDGADYLGVSAIFSTPTKTDAPPIGLLGLQEIRAAVDIPLVAIGGINAGNVRDVIRAGADGIAVVSAVMSAEDPSSAVTQLLQEVKAAKLEKR